MRESKGNADLIDDPKQLLLDMAQQRELPELLDLITSRLGTSQKVALARVWLIKPGEGCATCRFRPECPDQTRCLHLVASDGGSVVTPELDLTGLDGQFKRFPIGVRKVGRIALTGEAIEVADLEDRPSWIADPDWITKEHIAGFVGQPLTHRGTVLGVLGLFSRTRLNESSFDWLRMVANHAAAAIANAYAWDEIRSLKQRLEQENEYLKEEVVSEQGFGEMLGRSAPLMNIAKQIDLVAPTDSNVLVLGESGTGKELIAREIHRRSGRSDRPLIKVNCAAIPRELYESEFFGHVKGAFTGALRDRIGRFDLADGGTLFLDEVGEIPLDLQSKLLRVLQEGEIERVGDDRTRHVDVRIIAATNRDLRTESQEGRFREDLYYRLGVFPIVSPPLRERTDDLALLANHFAEVCAKRLGRKMPRLTKSFMSQLKAYSWPGNIRELQHVIERAVILSAGGPLRVDLSSGAAEPKAEEPQQVEKVLTVAEFRDFERSNLKRALEQCAGKVYGKEGAAELLGVKPTTLMSRLKSLDVPRR